MAKIEFYMKFNKKNTIHTCCKALASTTTGYMIDIIYDMNDDQTVAAECIFELHVMSSYISSHIKLQE